MGSFSDDSSCSTSRAIRSSADPRFHGYYKSSSSEVSASQSLATTLGYGERPSDDSEDSLFARFNAGPTPTPKLSKIIGVSEEVTGQPRRMASVPEYNAFAATGIYLIPFLVIISLLCYVLYRQFPRRKRRGSVTELQEIIVECPEPSLS